MTKLHHPENNEWTNVEFSSELYKKIGSSYLKLWCDENCKGKVYFGTNWLYDKMVMSSKNPYEVKVPYTNSSTERAIRFDWAREKCDNNKSRFSSHTFGDYVMYYFDDEEIAVEFALRFA